MALGVDVQLQLGRVALRMRIDMVTLETFGLWSIDPAKMRDGGCPVKRASVLVEAVVTLGVEVRGVEVREHDDQRDAMCRCGVEHGAEPVTRCLVVDALVRDERADHLAVHALHRRQAQLDLAGSRASKRPGGADDAALAVVPLLDSLDRLLETVVLAHAEVAILTVAAPAAAA